MQRNATTGQGVLPCDDCCGFGVSAAIYCTLLRGRAPPPPFCSLIFKLPYYVVRRGVRATHHAQGPEICEILPTCCSGIATVATSCLAVACLSVASMLLSTNQSVCFNSQHSQTCIRDIRDHTMMQPNLLACSLVVVPMHVGEEPLLQAASSQPATR